MTNEIDAVAKKTEEEEETNENDAVPEKTEEETKQNAEERTLTLRSSDGEEFVVSESAAFYSETIKNMVEDGCALTVVPLPVLDGVTLANFVTYLNKHAEFDKISEESKKKDFDEEFVNVEMNELFDLMTAANYLNVKGLLDLASKKVVDLIKNKSVKFVRKVFGIENDFTAAEEENLRQEYAWAWEGIDPDDD